MKKLSRSFYRRNTLDVAKNLLGKILVHRYEGNELRARIVETEAYIGAIDKAAHCYNNRRTERTKVMFGPPGYAYVYIIYGMYNCLNAVTQEKGEGAAVLIRAIHPLEGIEIMAVNRYGKTLEKLNKKQVINLTNGPGKLTMAMNITKENYGDDLTGSRLFIIDDGYKSFKIEKSKRINVDYAEEAANFEWRFSIKDNQYVSR